MSKFNEVAADRVTPGEAVTVEGSSENNRILQTAMLVGAYCEANATDAGATITPTSKAGAIQIALAACGCTTKQEAAHAEGLAGRILETLTEAERVDVLNLLS